MEQKRIGDASDSAFKNAPPLADARVGDSILTSAGKKLITVLLLLVIFGLLAWVLRALQPRSFHGRTENFWIIHLAEDPAAFAKFGPEAVPILTKALAARPGPLGKAYAKVWPKFPRSLSTILPQPRDYNQIHSTASALLAQQRSGTNIPLPPLARALQDPDWTVRANVLACFSMVVLPPPITEKEQILSLILVAVRDPQINVRMNAVYCLRFYKDHAERVIPILTKALTDDSLDVRVRAAMAFYEINPVAAEKSGALSVLFDSRSYQAPNGGHALAYDFLRKIGKLPKTQAN